MLSQVLHDWDDRRAALVLRRRHAAISPGAWLAVVERVLPSSGASWRRVIRPTSWPT